MLKKNKFAAFGAVAFALFLAGCSDSGEVKDNGAGGSTTPTSSLSTQGTGDTGAGAGTTTGTADLSQHSVYFDFDKSELKPEGQPIISSWAQYLKTNQTARVRLEGNCDERGTREYNIGLGERRANAVAQALESQGVASTQLTVVSYGKERPVALGHDEASWQQNRRVDLVQQ